METPNFTLRLCTYFKHIFRRYIQSPFLPNSEFQLQSAWRYQSPCWTTMTPEHVVAYFTAEQSWLNSSNGFSHFSLPHSLPNPYALVLAQSKSFHGEWWGSQQVRPIYIYRPRWFTRLNCCHYKSNIVIRNKRDHSICETEQGEGSGYGMEWNNGPLLYFIKTLWVQPNHLYDSNPTRKVITLKLLVLASPFWYCTPKPIMATSHDECYRMENNFFL